MDKSGKISKKKLQMQVYGMEGGKYELNMYTEEAEHLDELNKDTVYSYAQKANNDMSKKHKELAQQVRGNKPVEANKTSAKLSNRDKGLDRAEKRLNKEEAEHVEESQAHTAPETVKHYMKGQKTTTGVAKWVAQTIDKKKSEVKEAEEFKQGGKPLEKKFNKAFKDMGVDAKVKMKTTNNVSINEEEKEKPKKSFKSMKKNLEKTSDKDIKSGEKLSGKQEPINLSPTVDNNR
jgi:hypothetical protein